MFGPWDAQRRLDAWGDSSVSRALPMARNGVIASEFLRLALQDRYGVGEMTAWADTTVDADTGPIWPACIATLAKGGGTRARINDAEQSRHDVGVYLFGRRRESKVDRYGLRGLPFMPIA
jgi:hypothetical protein